MEAKFFKEIEKKMDVKTLKDFEKEIRTKINHELEVERKTKIYSNFQNLVESVKSLNEKVEKTKKKCKFPKLSHPYFHCTGTSIL